MKKLLINIICGFIPNRNRRNRIRMQLKYHNTIVKMIEFAKSHSTKKHPKIKTSIGFGCHNFVVIVDDSMVFKFPIKTDGKEIAIREKRITDALRPLSSIKIPKMEIINWNNITVRKYEFIRGVSLDSFSIKKRIKYADIIIKQLAKFLYEIGQADPKEIRDLKPTPHKKPSFMYGWYQNDLWYNFIMDPKTLKIKAFIDWEGTTFCDFGKRFKEDLHQRTKKIKYTMYF
ncbi:MAG: hypothetical protein IKN73_03505 [Alphaproteobacteria bacterium]|nr:hypothetical protein [Alphaproteobacteria bacterium]